MKIDTKVLLSRDEFREKVFVRDDFLCVNCGDIGQDAHHIIERRLFVEPFEKGGYFIDNGATVCGACHILAEQTLLTPETLRQKAGIETIILPDRYYHDVVYDKWGNIINNDGSRSPGELFHDESVQKILRAGNILNKFDQRVKYPRTMHLPWSNPSKDDKIITSLDVFKNQRVIQMLKLDGENQTMYHNAYHARSLDSDSHPSQTYARNIWGRIMGDIPVGWRLVGENLYAYHSIRYKNLASYFYLFQIWNDKNNCLSWDETLEYAQVLDLTTVPVIYDGVYDEGKIKSSFAPFEKNHEGYVVRLADEFQYKNFRSSVAKFVRKGHVSPDRMFWKFNWYPSDTNCNSIGTPKENGDPA